MKSERTSSRADRFRYRVDEPLNVKIKWEPEAEKLSSKLKEKIQKVVNLEEKPDFISGQRSSIITLDNLIDDFVRSFQNKGHFYRTSEDGFEIGPPQMLIYAGRGHPLIQLYVKKDGNLILEAPPDEPRGPICEESANIVMSAMRDMVKAGMPMVRPYGIGQIEGMKFSVLDSLAQEPETYNPFLKDSGAYRGTYLNKIHDVYCLIIGNPRKDDKRALDQVGEIAMDMEPKKRTHFLADFFGTYARTLTFFFDNEFVLGNPHIDNVSIAEVSNRLQQKAPNRLTTLQGHELVMHDPCLNGEPGYKKEHFTQKQWEGYVLADIANATETLLYFYHNRRNFEEQAKEVDKSKRYMVSRYTRLWEAAQGKKQYNPTKVFFKALLGEGFKELPGNFFDNPTLIDLSSQIKECYEDPNLKLASQLGRTVNYLDFLTIANPLVKLIRERFA